MVLSEVHIKKDKDELFIRFPFGEIERERSYEILHEKFEAFQRENEETDMGNVKLEFLEDGGVVCHFKNKRGFSQELPITDRALGGLFTKYRLNGVMDILNHPKREEALKLMAKMFVLQKERFTGRDVRFPTAVDGGVRRIIHVQSAKSPELNELQVLSNVQKATKGMSIAPAWAHVSENGFRMALIALTKELKMSSKGTQGHRIYGDGDTIFPGCYLTLSSTVLSNRVESFFFVQACENGSIFGEEAGYNIGIQRDNGIIQAIPAVLSALFKVTLDRAPQTMSVLQEIREESFNDEPHIETMARAASIVKVYDQYLKKPLMDLQDTDSNRLQAFQLLTETAHKVELPPEVQIRIEEMAGRYAYAGKAKVKPVPHLH